MASPARDQALSIWRAAVDAVLPAPLVARALAAADPVTEAVRAAPRVLVVGAGKAGPGMALGLEQALADRLDRVEGLVNVPEGVTAPLRKVRLHPARPQGVNEPTADGIAGADEMLQLLASCGPADAAVCLLSGGGSALLPAPAEGVTLSAKQAVTKLLHGCGATIDEMNCVRKHLSRVKGGRLAEAFRGRVLLGLVISDVIGDPLDVIASGPTAPDPTTFADALRVVEKYGLRDRVPESVLRRLLDGMAGKLGETPKAPDPRVTNRIIGSNRLALAAAELRAGGLGYRVWNAGSDGQGDTREFAAAMAELATRVLHHGDPVRPPACILSGGETTVTLGSRHGKGGRNQEFVLAFLTRLWGDELRRMTILSGGTDGEDGPTDAAGAVADADTWEAARTADFDPGEFRRRHDAYTFFDAVGGLIRTGLTGTNVMDVRVILVT